MEYGALTLIPIVFIIAMAVVTRKSFESLLAGSVIASIIMHGTGFFLPWVDMLMEALRRQEIPVDTARDRQVLQISDDDYRAQIAAAAARRNAGQTVILSV